jgi:cell surface protein SprA
MTKKIFLLTSVGLLSFSVLFAFTVPGRIQDTVFTLFFPEAYPPVAPDYDEVPGLAPQDTFPPLEERYDDFMSGQGNNPIDLKDPAVIQKEVEYDPVSGQYMVYEKIGDDYFRAPTYMGFDEYVKWREKQQQKEYFDRMLGVAGVGKGPSGLADPVAKFEVKNSLIDRLFGGTEVDIRPQGNINLTFGFDYQKIQNPILTLRQQRTGNFDFDMDINMSATGKIGEKLNLNFNYNTQATFDFDNQMKINYDTKNFSEDEIIQNIEAGNVSMPLRSNLIKGAQNLFGFKTELKFGHLRTTLIASQQRSRQQSLNIQGGAQVQQFEVPIDNYDENRHFFISHWNRTQFEPAMSCLPVPQSLFTITRMEVWLTNDRLATENVRDVVTLMDMAEPYPFNPNYALSAPPKLDITGQPLPTNENNTLYPQIAADLATDSTLRFSDKVVSRMVNQYGLIQIQDFEKVRARLLSPSEYTFNEQLGFLSINLNVQPDQVVGVALEYTYNGIPFKVGEFTSDVTNGDSLNQNVLFLKMLKSTTANVRYPIWDLMMKNVYAVGSANVDPNEFRFDIFYEDPGKGQKRFLNAANIPPSLSGKPLLQVFNLDNLNLQGDPGADGIFDFVPGLTVNLRSGRVMFPILEPFGGFLQKKMIEAGMDSLNTLQFVYPQLYDSTLFRAREYQQLNRFTLRGSYKSSTSSEITLGTFNLPRGSVRVSAGGRQLIEGADYEIDYNIGRVKILNDAILQSGQNVNVSFEDNTLFGFQNRSMFGARFDYALSKDINIGATYMNLFERPLTQKVNFGDDPINNRMYGLDFSISKDAPWLTRLVDALPLIETKEPSSISAQAEVALLDPGHNRAINQGGDRGGTTYIDDFEGSTANLPLANPANGWALASVPQGDLQLFPESQFSDSILMGANRAGLSWYIADPSARDGVDNNNPYTRLIQFQDIFPNRQLTPLEQSVLRPLDVTFYPRERGPYNFEIPEGYPGISKGFTALGELNEPATRWAGFMRGINTNDFEAANIEFIEFWMLNPYMDKGDGTPVSEPGFMYIDLGTISEDIMRDSRQFFENAVPTGPGTGNTVNTSWGRVPVLPPVVNAFDNDPAKRALQDVGFDGMDDENERQFYNQWLAAITNSSLGQNAKNTITADPAGDNFKFYLDGSFEDENSPNFRPGLLARYRQFNNPEGNSPVNQSQNLNPSATNLPDMEDLNRDNSLNENEAYFRYKINFPKTIEGGQEVINLADTQMQELVTDTIVFFRDGQRYVWYRFKLPLDYARREAIGGLQDFRSIRFVRMFWKGFTERTTFRFATLELGRNQWRRFNQYIGCPSDQVKPTPGPFDINAVSIEENAARTPFNYTIPFGIQREQSVGAFPDVLQNEQSLSVNICDLPFCEAKAIFKPLNMDLRQFKNLRMFAHAESVIEPLDSTQLSIFIRLGSDFFNNFYEYEIPLVASNPLNLNGNPDSREYKEEVWRPENNFDFPLELLIDVKKLRNADLNWPVGTPFTINDPDKPKNKVRVVGNPNLGFVKGVMIGIRNVDTLNKDLHCVEVWVNELRLNGFNEKAAVAGLARVDMKLADLGNISLAGNYTGIGWGSLEQRLIQRQREEVIQYDVSSNIELGRFLPKNFGLRLPFYAQYSNTTRIPEFDPYDLDIKLSDKLRDESDPLKRDSIRTLAQDVTIVRGFNFTNVRKERGQGATGKPLPFAIENFSFTYAFNQQRKRNPFIINDQLNQYKGAIDYQYSTGLKPIQPFKKLIKNDKHVKWLTELNFNPIPNTYGFNSTVERLAGVTTYRFAGEDPKLNTFYNRRFTWDRNYDLGWDIAKSLRFNFDATARSLIDEPLQFNPDGIEVTPQQRRDSIMTNLLNLGRPKNYTHNFSLNYTLPFKHIRILDWVSVKASYTAGYTWTAQSLKLQNLEAFQYNSLENSRDLGNVIQNNNVRQINGDLDFEKFYDKSPYLKKINKPGKGGAPAGRDRNTPGGRNLPGGDDPSSGGSGGPGAPGRGGLGSSGPGASDGKDAPPSRRSDRKKQEERAGADDKPPGAGADPAAAGADPAAGKAAAKADKDKRKDKEKDKDKKKERQPSMAERIAIRPLLLVRKMRFTYSENYGTVIPGFTPESKLMGLSEGFNAPGWEFVAGLQPNNAWLDNAGAQGWITHRPELNQQVTRNYTQNMDGSATIEPFQDFRVEVSANRQYIRNNTELFKDQNFNLSPDSVLFEHRAQRDMGSYTISYLAMNTLFGQDINALFDRYEENRSVISQRLGIAAGNTEQHAKDGPEFTAGYGRIQQEVLIPAFISAYTDKDPNSVGLNVFKTLPAPNWKLNYNGLSKLGAFKKIFSSVQIQHGYKSTLTVNSYNTDIFYNPQTPFTIDTLNFNYIARFEIPQVVINEQFQPLIGIDMKLKNDMTFRVDFKKSRILSMSFIDYQLAETQSSSYTVGFGYRLKDVNIPFLTGRKKGKTRKPTPDTGGSPGAGGGRTPATNDMTFKFDFDLRDDITINHRLDQLDQAVPTRGARTVSINPSIDYTLNRRLKLRLFTDYRKTVPKTSQSFPITTVNAGVTVQFTLN